MSSLSEIRILSFGFKWAPPPAANLLFDVRFLRNPFYVEELRPLTGAHEAVSNYVLAQPAAQSFLCAFRALVANALGGYLANGHDHRSITIAFGCTGGKHRSVCLAIQCADIVRDLCFQNQIQARVLIEHRDLGRE